MTRSLATPDGRYSHEEVLARCLSPNATVDHRHVLLNNQNEEIRELADVEDATVAIDTDQEVMGSLHVIMAADYALLGVPYRYRVANYWSIGPMRDHGRAELPMGIHVLSHPERIIQVGPRGRHVSDVWAMVMGDQQMILESGPGADGFKAERGELVTNGIRRALVSAGITDTSGVVDSDETFPESLRWTLKRGAQETKKTPQKKYDRSLARWNKKRAARAAFGQPPKGKRPKRRPWRDQDEPPETWNAILDDMAESIGYAQGYFDLSGVYRSLPAPDLSVDEPGFTYIAGKDGVLVDDVNSAPDFAETVNRVFVQRTSAQGKTKRIEVDLNDLLPTHPLAENQTELYFDLQIDAPKSASEEGMRRRGQKALMDHAVFFEGVRLVTACIPVLVAHDVVGVDLPEVPGFSGMEAYAGVGWSANLAGEPMEIDVNRTYRQV